MMTTVETVPEPSLVNKIVKKLQIKLIIKPSAFYLDLKKQLNFQKFLLVSRSQL